MAWFFVYYSAGAAYDQSLDFGIEGFDSQEEAEAQIIWLKKQKGADLNEIRLIKGNEIVLFADTFLPRPSAVSSE